MSQMHWIILLCGVGTFALRWLPFWKSRMGSNQSNGHNVKKWLAGVGPAAIAALLVVSVWGSLATDFNARRIIAVVLALCTVATIRRLLGGGVAISSLAGAATYGLLMQITLSLQ